MQLSLPISTENPLRSVRDRLLAVHGSQRDALRHDPVSQAIKAILGACTRDGISNAPCASVYSRSTVTCSG